MYLDCCTHCRGKETSSLGCLAKTLPMCTHGGGNITQEVSSPLDDIDDNTSSQRKVRHWSATGPVASCVSRDARDQADNAAQFGTNRANVSRTACPLEALHTTGTWRMPGPPSKAAPTRPLRKTWLTMLERARQSPIIKSPCTLRPAGLLFFFEFVHTVYLPTTHHERSHHHGALPSLSCTTDQPP